MLLAAFFLFFFFYSIFIIKALCVFVKHSNTFKETIWDSITISLLCQLRSANPVYEHHIYHMYRAEQIQEGT